MAEVDRRLSDKLVRLPPDEHLVLGNVRLPLDDNATVHIEVRDGRFARVGSDPIDAGGARTIDGQGRYLIPGLIDAHVHFTGDVSSDPYRRYITPRDTARAIRAALDAQAVLSGGFTTVRALGHAHADITYGLRDCIENGWWPGPRILTSGWAISQTGGHGNLRAWPYELVEQRRPRSMFADGEIELRKAVRRNFGEGADLIKIYVSEGRVDSPPRYRNKPNFTLEEIQAITDEAHRRGAKVAAHATTADGARNAIRGGVDTIEHGPRHGDPELAAMMAEQGTYFIPTLSVYYRSLKSKAERNYSKETVAILEAEQEGSAAFLKDALEAGVRIVCGSDTSTRPAAGNNAKEIELLVEGGCSTRQALQAATCTAAEALGVYPQLGRIAEGSIADAVLLTDNPLDDITVLQEPDRIVSIFQSTVAVA